MKTILITYDLKKPGQDYKDLIDKIKSLSSNWWHCLESVWIIKTNLSPFDVVSQLLPHVDNSDRIFSTEVSKNWACFIKTNDECVSWLQRNV